MRRVVVGAVTLAALAAGIVAGGLAAQEGTPRLGEEPRPEATRAPHPLREAVSRPVQECPDPLAALVEEALRNDLGLEQERLLERRARAEVREARAGFFPSLSLESRYSEQEGVLDLGEFVNPAYQALNELTGTSRFPADLEVTLPYRFESRARLTQTVFDERVRAVHALSKRRLEGQRWEGRAATRQLAAEVQAAYLALAMSRSTVRIYEAGLALVEENERVAERLVEAGDATPDRVFRARAERSDVEQRLAEAGERASAAQRSLNRILGRPLDAIVEEHAEADLCLELAVTEEEAVASALARREELARAETGIREAEAGQRLARASLVPRVSLAVDYGVQGSEVDFGSERDFLVGSLVLSWSFFNGGRDIARREAARLDADRARVRRQELGERIELEVRQAHEAAVVAGEAIRTADDRLAAARRTFDLVRRRYQEGLASQVEFVDARTSLTNAELNRTLTVYRYATRLVELRRAAATRELDDEERSEANHE